MENKEIMNIPRPEHPEPMMKRCNWQNLNGEWLFEFDFGNTGKERGMYRCEAAEKYTKKITVPFCPESKLSGIEYKDHMYSVWYKRTVNVDADKLRGNVLLHFGAVDYESHIYVNGNLAGNHFGGYSSFTIDVTSFLHEGENDITVHAVDDTRNPNTPSGKQSTAYYSKGCSYTRTTGIWQTVWLEFVPKAYIKSAKYFPHIDDCSIDVELELSQGGNVKVEAFYDEKPVGQAEKSVTSNYARLTLPLSEKHLWEVGCGRLYDLKLSLTSGVETDTVNSYAGLREIRIDGFKVLINDKVVFQRTVLDQGFYPDGIYTAPTDDDLKKDIELSMAVGFNGARLHEKIFEPRFLYHCDKAGYIVWGEHANWGHDSFKPEGLLGFLPEWTEAVKRDFNHPAIIGWCPFNETWNGKPDSNYIRNITAVYTITKQLDPTRPVIDTSGGYHVISDIYDQHDYDQNPVALHDKYKNYNGSKDSFEFRFEPQQIYIPNLPFFLSEFGGIRWVRDIDKEKIPENSWGYGQAPATEEEFFSRYEGLSSALLDCPNIMGFCYTQLYDVEQEVNGIYCYSREPKFPDYSRIKAANMKIAAIEK